MKALVLSTVLELLWSKNKNNGEQAGLAKGSPPNLCDVLNTEFFTGTFLPFQLKWGMEELKTGLRFLSPQLSRTLYNLHGIPLPFFHSLDSFGEKKNNLINIVDFCFRMEILHPWAHGSEGVNLNEKAAKTYLSLLENFMCENFVILGGNNIC